MCVFVYIHFFLLRFLGVFFCFLVFGFFTGLSPYDPILTIYFPHWQLSHSQIGHLQSFDSVMVSLLWLIGGAGGSRTHVYCS